MDHKIPFTSYDFWAYLSAGFLLLFALDQVCGTKLLMRDSWTVVQSVIAVSLAYITGQIVASLSLWLLEGVLIAKWLGYPRNVLFGQVKAWRWVRWVIPGYFNPLPDATQKAVLEKGGRVGVRTPGEALFWPAFANARATPAVMSRLNDFLNLYGFCRNVALVGLLDAALFYGSYLQPTGPAEHLLWSRISLLVGVGMTIRYLMFFRLYACEVFTSFAYAKDDKAT